MRNRGPVAACLWAIFLLLPSIANATDVGGPIEADQTWTVADSPVQVTDDIRISEGATLTIDPGVDVHLNGNVISSHWGGFPIGYLAAVGVRFLGSSGWGENVFIKPSDHVEGCSFGGVRLLLDADGGTLSTCSFTTDFYGIMIQGAWTVQHCDFTDCAIGIWMQATAPASIRHCNFNGGGEGFHFLELNGFPDLEIRYCNFQGVAQGIVVDGDPVTDFIDATWNFWGQASGPTHPANPGGTGVPIDDGVAFDPWLTDPATPTSAVPAGHPLDRPVLHGNSPNPFNPATVIAFDLPRAQTVELAVFGLDGRRVATLVRGWRGPGRHEVVWRGRDDAGGQAGSGTYVYRLEAGDAWAAGRMVLVR